jgi:hypothetical protein
MDSLGWPELLVILGVVLFLAPTIFYILTLQRVLTRCSPQARARAPRSVWLLLIPVFGLIWQFILVSDIARSLANEYALRQLPLTEPEPGKTIGLAMSILCASSIIPIVGAFTGIAGVVCWIVYWVKIAGYSRSIAAPPQLGPPTSVSPSPWG